MTGIAERNRMVSRQQAFLVLEPGPRLYHRHSEAIFWV